MTLVSRLTRVTLAALTLLAISACEKKPETQTRATSDKPLTVAPMGFAKADADAEVRLTLPEPIRLHPELHSQLYNDGERKLKDFITRAHADRAQMASEGMEAPAYFHSINWKISGQSPRLLSIYAEEEDYQGGAHPNSTFQALLWDKSKKELLNTAKLFKTGADMKAADAYVCSQVEAERSRRLGEPTTQADSGFSCPRLADSRLILIPSAIDGKFAAIDALYPPYEVGPYVEGAYVIRVPFTVVQAQLNPDFADQFGGEPVKDPASASGSMGE